MKGVLLINTGAPETNHPKDLKKFQEEILKDSLVIDAVHGIPEFTSDEINEKVSENELSFHKISRSFLKKIQKNTQTPIALSMRYGKPNIKNGLNTLKKQGATEILVLPLYPHYASSTVESIIKEVGEIQDNHFPNLEIEYIHTYYNRSEYIEVIADSIARVMNEADETHFIFSYHGVPEHFSVERDFPKNQCTLDGVCCDPSSKDHEFCYKKQCLGTTEKTAEKLDLKPNSYTTAFQSRLNLEPWLQPSTKKAIKQLGKDGVKNLVLVCPGFAVDSQDTKKIASAGKDIFLNTGGKTFTVIPCLNDRDNWVDVVTRWIDRWRIVDLKTAIA